MPQLQYQLVNQSINQSVIVPRAGIKHLNSKTAVDVYLLTTFLLLQERVVTDVNVVT